MRIDSPRSLPADNVSEEIRGHAAQLMLLTIEVGLIHREGIDQLFDLVVGVRPQNAKYAWNDSDLVAPIRSTRRRSM
jgi:hypothetical protein